MAKESASHPEASAPIAVMIVSEFSENSPGSNLGYAGVTSRPTTPVYETSRDIQPSETSLLEVASQEQQHNAIIQPQLKTQPSMEHLDPPEVVHLVTTSPLKHYPDVPPAASLVSPPASTHTDNESTPPAPSSSSSVKDFRQSSRQANKTAQRYTPESGPARRASTTSLRSLAGLETAKKGRKESWGEDEESLALIRSLQAEEYGLRRRGRG